MTSGTVLHIFCQHFLAPFFPLSPRIPNSKSELPWALEFSLSRRWRVRTSGGGTKYEIQFTGSLYASRCVALFLFYSFDARKMLRVAVSVSPLHCFSCNKLLAHSCCSCRFSCGRNVHRVEILVRCNWSRRSGMSGFGPFESSCSCQDSVTGFCENDAGHPS